MPPEDRTRIIHMIEAAENGLNSSRDGNAQTSIQIRCCFSRWSGQMLLFALVRAIEVVGEAASRITEATRNLVPDIPWSLVVSMRNRPVHAYFDVDNDVVWTTATEELPALPASRRALAPQHRPEIG